MDIVQGAKDALDRSEEVLLTAKEYTEVFRCSLTSVYRSAKDGRLEFPVHRPTGGALLIRVPRSLLTKLGKSA